MNRRDKLNFFHKKASQAGGAVSLDELRELFPEGASSTNVTSTIHRLKSAPQGASLDELRGLFPGAGSSSRITSTIDRLKNSPQSGSAVSLDELRELFPGATPSLPQAASGAVSLNELRELFPQSSVSGPQPNAGDSTESYRSKVERGFRNLSVPMTDDDSEGMVSEVQRLLQGHGYMLSGSGVDGIYGDGTHSAVAEFQRRNGANGLMVSGEVDARTLAVLRSPIAVKRVNQQASPSASSTTEVTRETAGAVSSAGISRVSAGQLYADLMAGIPNKNLCKAMVANAIAESGLRVNTNGDCGSYAKSRSDRSLDTSLYPNVFYKPRRGRCCSFGLWQYNICGGLGNSLLKAYGVGVGRDSTDAEKIAVLTSYEKQVAFMIKHVNRKAKVNSDHSVDWWVDWFVRKVERPANMDRAVVKRQNIARGLRLA